VAEYSFPKSARLLRRADFLALLVGSRKISTKRFLIVWKQLDSSSARIGITVSKKVGNSVVRNRIKRYVREYFRQNKAYFVTAQYNIIAKKGADELDFRQVSRELDSILGQITI
jgi:ribonuclease P protein component